MSLLCDFYPMYMAIASLSSDTSSLLAVLNFSRFGMKERLLLCQKKAPMPRKLFVAV